MESTGGVVQIQSIRQSGSIRLLAICALFFSPVALTLLFVVSGIAFPFILLLYAIIVIEGIALSLWVLSKINTDETSALLMGIDVKKTPTDLYRYYHNSHQNRAEALAGYIKAASKRRSGYYREHCRSEIARVITHILEESHSFPPPNRFTRKEEGTVSSNDLSEPNQERRLLMELDFLLHPPEETKEKQPSKGQKTVVLEEKSKPVESEKRSLDYLSTIDHVLKKFESNV